MKRILMVFDVTRVDLDALKNVRFDDVEFVFLPVLPRASNTQTVQLFDIDAIPSADLGAIEAMVSKAIG